MPRRTHRIEEKLLSLGLREVPSERVGELVMRELRKLDKVAYVRFASVYRSFEDVDEFGDADACALEPGGDGSLRCDEGTLVLRSHWLPLASRLRVQANVVSMRVDPRQGTFSPTGSWEVSSGEQHRLRHVVNLLGRTRLCTPELRLPGVPPC
jgi:hypothetical protein